MRVSIFRISNGGYGSVFVFFKLFVCVSKRFIAKGWFRAFLESDLFLEFMLGLVSFLSGA